MGGSNHSHATQVRRWWWLTQAARKGRQVVPLGAAGHTLPAVAGQLRVHAASGMHPNLGSNLQTCKHSAPRLPCISNHDSPPPRLPPKQDLYDSIARGEYPEWKLFIQTMDPAVSGCAERRQRAQFAVQSQVGLSKQPGVRRRCQQVCLPALRAVPPCTNF